MSGLRHAAAAFAALVLALSPAAAHAIPRPLNPTAAGAAQPKLLSDYERRVLTRELHKLMEDVRSRRAKAEADESLAPLRDALAAAKALSDAVETKLYEDPEIPPKIKRLQEVGNLLEFDSRIRREQRASHPEVRRRPPEPPAEVAPGPGEAAPGADTAPADAPAPAEEDDPETAGD